MKDRTSRFGIRHPAFLEVTLFLTFALAVDRLFLDGTRFRSLSQHPFWILVLLVTVQYGTNAGLFAAIASSVALLAGNMPLQPAFQDRFQWLFEVIRLPLLWCLTAVTLGELRMRQIRERERLRGQVEEASRRDQILTDGYKRLNAVKEALETRVAGQLRTAVSLYEAARAIEKLDPAEVLLGVSSLVRSVMNPEKFSLYLLKNGALELAFSEGWTSEDRFPRLYTRADPLFQETIGRQRMVSVANPEDERIFAGVGLIAAPLIAPDTGHVAGMLQIERLGFLDLNFSNVQTFKVLCEWIGAAYDNALRYQTARSEGVMNAQTELFAYGFLARQLSLFTLLARRIGFDLTMIVVRLENPDGLTNAQRVRVPIAFGQMVSKVLRQSDLVFDYQRTGAEFALVLPATKANGAYMVIDKLEAGIKLELGIEAPQARFSYAVHTIHDTDRVEAAINSEEPRLDLEYA
jgi:polysaccharide biosynthesis protein PelD